MVGVRDCWYTIFLLLFDFLSFWYRIQIRLSCGLRTPEHDSLDSNRALSSRSLLVPVGYNTSECGFVALGATHRNADLLRRGRTFVTGVRVGRLARSGRISGSSGALAEIVVVLDTPGGASSEVVDVVARRRT